MIACNRGRIRCRQIRITDADTIANLLVTGFPGSEKKDWIFVLKALANHPSPSGFPKFGYMMEEGSTPVGALLTMYTELTDGVASSVRCNFSGWYVDPRFRNFASLLTSAALKHQHATYMNVTAMPHTWPIIEAQGFRRFCQGTFASVPALRPSFGQAKITEFRKSHHAGKLAEPECRLLDDHSHYGCLSLICETSSGAYPLIVRRRLILTRLGLWRHLPAARLIFCPSLEVLCAAFAPLGRFLLGRGIPILLIGSEGPLPLPGKYFPDKRPMYYRGAKRPLPWDIAYTESALLGI